MIQKSFIITRLHFNTVLLLVCISILLSGIHLRSWDIYSFYQPDSMKFVEFNGEGYIITTNEGESVDYEIGTREYADAKRGRLMLEGGFWSIAHDITNG